MLARSTRWTNAALYLTPKLFWSPYFGAAAETPALIEHGEFKAEAATAAMELVKQKATKTDLELMMAELLVLKCLELGSC